MNKTQNTQNQTNLTIKPNMLVARKTIAWISYNFRLSSKAKEQAVKFFNLKKSIKQMIFDSPLAWKNNNKFYIALDLFSYLIVEVIDDMPIIQEIVDTSETHANYTVVDQMAEDYKIFKIEDEYAMIETLWEKLQENPIGCAIIQRTIYCGYAMASFVIDFLEDQGIISRVVDGEDRKILCERAKFVTWFSDALNHGRKQGYK